MKKLFIYYSFTGNGDVVAEIMKEKGYDIRKVIMKKKMPKTFFSQMMVGGLLAGLGSTDKLVNYNPNVSEYEEIVIGSPIWNGRIPPATNGVLKQTDLSNKKVTFVFYSGSGEGTKALLKVNNLYPDAKVVFLKEPKKYKEELEKLKEL